MTIIADCGWSHLDLPNRDLKTLLKEFKINKTLILCLIAPQVTRQDLLQVGLKLFSTWPQKIRILLLVFRILQLLTYKFSTYMGIDAMILVIT